MISIVEMPLRVMVLEMTILSVKMTDQLEMEDVTYSSVVEDKKIQSQTIMPRKKISQHLIVRTYRI
jgi:hypothetical protein